VCKAISAPRYNLHSETPQLLTAPPEAALCSKEDTHKQKAQNSQQNGDSALSMANVEQGKEREGVLDIVTPHNNIHEQVKIPFEFRKFISDFCLPGDPTYDETAELFIIADTMGSGSNS
jgi:hypothetical protein